MNEQAETKCEDDSAAVAKDAKAEPPKRRLPYEKPVLKRLGSVNKLTLSASQGAFTDGSRQSPKMAG